MSWTAIPQVYIVFPHYLVSGNQEKGLEPLRTTPLKDLQSERGAKFVPFGGWSLPVSYSGIMEEYWAVRLGCGVFDVSHMGRFGFEGEQAAELLDTLLTHSIRELEEGQGRYCVMCRPDGGILDDVICFRLQKERFFLVVNGATREKDWAWINRMSEEFSQVRIKDYTLETAMVALQGPKAMPILKTLFEDGAVRESVKRLWDSERFQIFQVLSSEPLPLLISTTGYTGEEGVEVYGPPQKIQELWQIALEQGAAPAGLGARDLLRLEMGYLLYGQDATEEQNPYEARLGWTVNLSKPTNFIGKDALVRVKETGPEQSLVGLVLEGRNIPRSHFKVFRGEHPAGQVTSGGYSPWRKAPIALAYLEGFKNEWGEKVEVEIRGKRAKAEVVRPPLIDRTVSPTESSHL